MTRVPRTTWWSTCGCSPPATCSGRASSSSTSLRVGGLSRSSASRRWSPCARRATISTSSRWPRPSASPFRWSTWTAARAAPPTRTSSPRAPSPRSTFSTGLDTTTSSTNRAGPARHCPAASPLPGARHVQRFLCGCKWSYFTPPSLSHNLPCFIKGDADGEPRVRVPALLLPTWLLCVWLPPFPPGGFLSAFRLPTPKLPTSSSLEGPGLLGPTPGYWVLLPSRLPASLLSLSRKFGSSLGICPGIQDHPSFKLLPHRPHLHSAFMARAPDPSCLPSIKHLHGLRVLGGEGRHDGGAWLRAGGGARTPPVHPRWPQSGGGGAACAWFSPQV